jgi:hypothetical protein
MRFFKNLPVADDSAKYNLSIEGEVVRRISPFIPLVVQIIGFVDAESGPFV